MENSSLKLVLEYYSPASAACNRFLGFLRGLAEMGVEAEVFCMVPDRYHSRPVDELPGIRFHCLWRKRCPLWLNWVLSTLSLRLKLHRGDRVALFVSFVPFLVVMSWLRHVRCFVELTEYPLLFNNGWVMRIFRWVLIRRYRCFAGMLVISRHLKEWLVSRGVPEEKITILNMICDAQRFIQLRADPKASRRISYCGSVSIFKDGVDMLIQAFQRIIPDYPDVELHIYGPFQNAETERKLRELAACSPGAKIFFKGRVDREHLPQYLMDSSILALTRPDNIQAHFGFPTKLGEYLLTGNPVVVTRVGEIPDFLTDHKDSLLIEPGDVEACARAFEWLFSHPGEMRRIGMGGRETALKCFHHRTEAKKLLTAMDRQ